MAKTSEFHSLRDDLLKDRRLYNDPAFQAIPKSIYFSKPTTGIRWRRPTDICRNPRYIVDGATRFDLDQGSIGNCWYIAAAATLATRKDLFYKVIPKDQGFGDDYAGVFRFHFWRYGKWVEVIIDDKLPTINGHLIFCKNREEPEEFWSALLEKAYAKLHGSYEALEGGWTEDALVDFTGGIGQRINLLKERGSLPPQFFDILMRFQTKKSLMGCSINATQDTMESRLPNGLVIGHAYSITKLLKTQINSRKESLIRLRNPWGQTEWKGRWSDGSPEWRGMEPAARKALGLVYDDDGEFWMSFDDWVQSFEQIQICHLSPDAKVNEPREWHEVLFEGQWIKGVSAGGCGNPPYAHLYWTNPQYSITITPSDPRKPKEKAWMVVSLMQKHSRLLRSLARSDQTHISISFDLYKVKDKVPKVLEGENYSRYALDLTKRGSNYEFCREMTHTFHEEPGTYVVIPSTFEPNVNRKFLVRVYTEGADIEGGEMDIETGPIREPTNKQRDVIGDLFLKYSGEDRVIDAKELQSLLNEAFCLELSEDHEFELEACRSLLCMMDNDKNGTLDFDEVKRMWIELLTWQNTFRQFDKDRSGYISISELRSVFKSVGYNVSRGVMEALVRRYGGKEARLPFDDFVIAMCKVITLLDVFAKVSRKGKAELDQEHFMQLTLSF